jgi:hypothetical protein
MMRMNSKTRRAAASAAAGFVTFYVGVPAISLHHLMHASQPLYSNNDEHAPEREPAQSQTRSTITITSSAAASVPGSSVAFGPRWAHRLGPGE